MSAPLTISSASLEYVRVPVYAKQAGSVVNWTADVTKMAFKQNGTTPSSGDFVTVTSRNETDATTTPPTYYVVGLVGAGGDFALAAGTYQCWVKITDSPEIPVKQAGSIVVT